MPFEHAILAANLQSVASLPAQANSLREHERRLLHRYRWIESVLQGDTPDPGPDELIQRIESYNRAIDQYNDSVDRRNWYLDRSPARGPHPRLDRPFTHQSALAAHRQSGARSSMDQPSVAHQRIDSTTPDSTASADVDLAPLIPAPAQTAYPPIANGSRPWRRRGITAGQSRRSGTWRNAIATRRTTASIRPSNGEIVLELQRDFDDGSTEEANVFPRDAATPQLESTRISAQGPREEPMPFVSSLPDLPQAHSSEQAEGGDDNRANKRRKTDTGGLASQFMGFSYGYKGQVVPGKLKMEIQTCDGGMYHDDQGLCYSANNILKNDTSVYCTKDSRCNLVLRHQGSTPFSVAEIIIMAPAGGYTAPVQEGLVFIAMDNDDALQYTTNYQIQYTLARRSSTAVRPDLDSTITDRPSAHRPYRLAQIPAEFEKTNTQCFDVTTTYNDYDSDSDAPPQRSQSFRRQFTRRGGRLVNISAVANRARLIQPDIDTDQSSTEDDEGPDIVWRSAVDADVRAEPDNPHILNIRPAAPHVPAASYTDHEIPFDDTPRLVRLRRMELSGDFQPDPQTSPAEHSLEAAARTAFANHGARLRELRRRAEQVQAQITRATVGISTAGEVAGPTSWAGEAAPRTAVLEQTRTAVVAPEEAGVLNAPTAPVLSLDLTPNAMPPAIPLLTPHARFFIERDSCRCKIVFNPPVSGRYVLLKMWSPGIGGGNIDIQSVTIRGYAGPRLFYATKMR